jgi:hypothetical protein
LRRVEERWEEGKRVELRCEEKKYGVEESR